MKAIGAPGVVPLLFPPLLLKEELTVHCNAAGEGHAGLCHPTAGLNCYRATARRLQSDGCFSCHFGGIRTGSRHARPSGVIEFDSAVTVGGEQDWPGAGRYGHCASSEVMLNLPLGATSHSFTTRLISSPSASATYRVASGEPVLSASCDRGSLV